ncbi:MULTISPECIES: GNAT family N-acetyltransferase [Chryseobacterium]|uniref:GNAT family N-acetyltransferase n=1 Tax=Chryseobacterium TaxID=59732 RepID=UPI0012981217|nr:MULTISPECIES: GNAT family N-acetyltransferase [Chryseobacterium]MDR6921052.1 RimJ/RimL family protein N-acetyltransferase [Chryseobacterium sp. 2987]
MVTLQFFKEDDLFKVNYALDEDQLRFTSTAEQAIQRIKERNDHQSFAVIIMDKGLPVGFFVLDFGEDKLDLTNNKDSVLLRSLSVNPEMQGKGIGKEAMQKVDDFVRENFSHCNEIVLAVNQKNESAYHIYRKAGYSYDGKTRIGRSGRQYLMYKKL